ncbi:Uncharacterised protein [Paucimonas lemoignei]|jgi:hypothetical protein|nr:Uncharacterised protein [Paucimonas lemoignei]
MPTPAQSIENYILAKDGNRPHLLRQAFTGDASLEMIVRTGTISFPPKVEGRDGIAEVLVRRFGQTYENVYTLCLGEKPSDDAIAHHCKWLVGMSDKATGELRFGCGHYDWQFDTGLATQLSITIEHMLVRPEAELLTVMDWLQQVSYPWCSDQQLALAPSLTSIQTVRDYLKA